MSAPKAPKAMLAVPLEPGDYGDMHDPSWAMQKKIDGHRHLIRTGPDGPVGFNREGRRINMPPGVEKVMGELDHPGVFDGEFAQGVLHLFDLPYYEGIVSAQTPWARRDMTLRQLVKLWRPDETLLRLVPFVRSGDEKVAMLATLAEAGDEGVVFKRLDSPYTPGKSTAWRKMKFVDDVDAVIVGAGVNGKANYTLAMADPHGTVLLPGGIRGREVGRVSALTGDGPCAEIGQVVTVQVTGLGASGRLVEPRTPRIRTDKSPADCGVDQLDTLRRISR